MDLGISGRTALVCASTQGLGFACARALLAEGVEVFINGRQEAKVQAAISALRSETGGVVGGVAADVTTPTGRKALLEKCPRPDILINNNAGPQPAAFADLDDETWLEAISANMIAPIQLVRSVLPSMRSNRFGRIVNITSAMVTTPRPHMTLSAGARAGLTAAMKGLSFEVVKDDVTINNLLPERIDTDRQHRMAKLEMKREGIGYEEARNRQIRSIAARRLGSPTEFGAVCAFLCSALSGFISGMNVHVDGGSYPGLI